MSYAFLSSSLQKSTRGSSVPSSLRHRMLADLSNTGDAPPWSLSVSAALGANHFLGTGTTDPGFHTAMTTGAATVARGDFGMHQQLCVCGREEESGFNMLFAFL